MLGILALIMGGLSIGLSVLPSFAGTAGTADEADPGQGQDLDDYTDQSDLIVSDEHAEILGTILDVIDEPMPEPELVEGALRVNSGAGDDVVVGSSAADVIHSGDGDDVVAGGMGNDRIELGAGDDVYGLNPLLEDYEADHLQALGVLELGNDKVRGGVGDDSLSDRFGSNRLIGNQGDDTLVGLDDASEAQATPDILLGGFGDDHIHADEGDVVVGGRGVDTITLHLSPTMGDADPQPIVIEDFAQGVDKLELEGLNDGSDLGIRDMEDATGAEVLLDGKVVARVLGGAGLTLGDVLGDKSA